MIRRGPRLADHFTVLPNAALRDSALSFRARGLLAFLVSQPPDYSVNCRVLMNEAREGREAVLAALRELEECGYLARKKVAGTDGKWRTESIVTDSPSPGFRDPVFRDSEEEGLEEGLLVTGSSEVTGSDGLSPSGGASVNASPAQALVSYYVDQCRTNRVEPPRRLVGQMAKQISGLLEEGFAVPTLRNAVRWCAEEGKSPIYLHNLVVDVQLQEAGR